MRTTTHCSSNKILRPCLVALLLFVLNVSEIKAEETTPAEQKEIVTVITGTKARREDIDVLAKSVGWVESVNSPQIMAEVDARVLKVFAATGQQVKAGEPLAELDGEKYRYNLKAGEAEVDQLEAQIAFQQKTVRRFANLYKKKSTSLDRKEEAELKRDTLQAQLAAAKARNSDLERLLRNTRVVSPIAGLIDERHISVGDYVKVGTPLFGVVNDSQLKIYLPFPEGLTPRLKPGLPVQLTTPLFPGKNFSATITSLRPAIQSDNRAVFALIDIEGAEGWHPGATVNGTVVVDHHPKAIVVPEASVVRRPAGEVVYIIAGNRAHEQVVTTGERQPGLIEIRSGVQENDTIAVDGAGFLSDQSAVRLRERH